MKRLFLSFMLLIAFPTLTMAQNHGSKHFGQMILDVALPIGSGGLGNSIGAADNLTVGGLTLISLLGPGATPSITNPSSSLTLSPSTTAYAGGQLIGNSSVGASISVPSIIMPQVSVFIPRIRVAINDSTATGWGGKGIVIDLWSAAPTFSNGDRSAFFPATGAANHIGSYSCTFSPVYGDGVYAECAPIIGSSPAYALATPNIYWTAQTSTLTGVTRASAVMTVTLEVSQ